MSNASRNLLQGAYDLQVHAGPDIVPRKIDAVELVQEARRAGMDGVLIKDHVTMTADRAAILNRLYPDFQVFGALALNYPVGGLNPEAVIAAIRHGASQIYMPTFAAANDVVRNGGIKPVFKNLFPRGETKGLRIIDEAGRLLPEVEHIIEIMSESDAILGTGHLSPEESLLLIAQAARRGVKHILVTHAMGKSVDMSVRDQKRAVELGAHIEQSYLGCTPFSCQKNQKEQRREIRKMASQIRAIGAEHLILSTDLGQKKNISPVEGLSQFIENLLIEGISEDEIDLMVRLNPEKLLGARK